MKQEIASQAEFYQLLADAYQERGKHREARKLSLKALNLYSDHGDLLGMARQYQQMATIASAELDNDRALACWLSARNGYSQAGDTAMVAQLEQQLLISCRSEDLPAA